MLHGVILYSDRLTDTFTANLHTISHVKWVSILSSVNLHESDDFIDFLPDHCNLVIILDPACTSFRYLSGLVRKGCHLFLPEQQKMTLGERLQLIQLAEEGNTFIQIRNDLLFHSSLSVTGIKGSESKLVEIHHSEPGRFNYLQEMLYTNLLMTLKILDSEPARISVCSIPGSEYQPDVVNLHMNFHNGSAASLTLSFTGEQKVHQLSVHSAGGVLNYNFRKNGYNSSRTNPAIKELTSNHDEVLFKQIVGFSDCVAKKNFQKFGLSDESRTFHLMEKINRKLELSLV